MLNIDGYYDGLLGLFDKGVEEGFINPSSRTIVVTATTSAELINKLEVDHSHLSTGFELIFIIFMSFNGKLWVHFINICSRLS